MPTLVRYLLVVTIGAGAYASPLLLWAGWDAIVVFWPVVVPPIVVVTLPPLPMARVIQRRLAGRLRLPSRIVAYASAFVPCLVWVTLVIVVGFWTGYMSWDVTIEGAIFGLIAMAMLTSIIVSLSLPARTTRAHHG